MSKDQTQHDHFLELEEEIEAGKKGKNLGLHMGFPRLYEITCGLQRAKYVLLFASEGVGKSSFALSSYILHPYEYVRKYKPYIQFRVRYYCLEEKKVDILAKIAAWKLYHDERTVTKPSQIISMTKKQKITPYIEKRVLSQKEYINDLLNNCLTIIDKPMTPSQIKEDVMNYAAKNGRFYNDENGIQRYKPHNPNEFTIILTDTLSNLATELVDGKTTKKGTIDLHSANCRDIYRNKLGYLVVNVAHSNRNLSNVGRVNAGELFPDKSDIMYSSTPSQDANQVLAIFNPLDYISMNPSLKSYMGYDVKRMKGRFRALGVLKNRGGSNNKRLGMLFVGECSYFTELPHRKAISENDYHYIQDIKISEDYEKHEEEQKEFEARDGLRKLSEEIRGLHARGGTDFDNDFQRGLSLPSDMGKREASYSTPRG